MRFVYYYIRYVLTYVDTWCQLSCTILHYAEYRGKMLSGYVYIFGNGSGKYIVGTYEYFLVVSLMERKSLFLSPYSTRKSFECCLLP